MLQIKTNSENDIVRAMAERLGMTKEEVVGPSRRQDRVRVRSFIAYLLREYSGMSYPAIGRLLGGRDHTTIIHAYRKVKRSVSETSSLEREMSDFTESLKAIKERKQQIEKEGFSAIVDHDNDIWKAVIVIPKIKEISDRNIKALELFREGLTLENIGNEIGVTRERIRQIVASTIKQMALNEAISKDIVMDPGVLLEEEKKKHHIVQGLKKQKKAPVIREKRWSVYYSYCRKCKTISIPHVRKGLCEQCVGQFGAKRRKLIYAQHDNRCDSCKMSRGDVIARHGRDLFIMKNKKVLCKSCFLQTAGKTLGDYKNYAWSRFHSKCKSCGTTSKPHMSRGLCEECSEIMTNERREKVISSHKNKCDDCNIDRTTAQSMHKKDFYIIKAGKVLCQSCFHKYLGVMGRSNKLRK